VLLRSRSRRQAIAAIATIRIALATAASCMPWANARVAVSIVPTASANVALPASLR
jgi:hypothetical protein